MQDQQGRPAGQAVVIEARRTVSYLILGFLALVFVLALAASETAQGTTGGRITAAVFFGALLLLTLAGFYAARRAGRQLVIGPDAIISRPRTVRAPRPGQGNRLNAQPVTYTRHPGDTLRILPQFRAYGLIRRQKLVFLGRGGFIPLSSFPVDRVRRGCEEQGWRFDGDPALAVRDVQDWLHHGYSVDAVQLLQLFGPFPAAAADGQPDTGLDAAVYEDVGDKLASRAGTARRQAKSAYTTAAAAQRAFAGYALTPAAAQARLSEADRIAGKAAAVR